MPQRQRHHGYSRYQNNIPVPFLYPCALQPLEVDYLLLEVIVLRWKLFLGCDGSSVLADTRVPFRGENFAKDVFPGSPCSTEDKCAQSYKRKIISATLWDERCS